MNGNRHPWAPFGVTATTTALFASCVLSNASATQTHVLQKGESLSALARRFHVSVPDIVRANQLTDVDNLREGRKLLIPDPPKRLLVSARVHKRAVAKGDRTSIRMGPGADYRRLDFCDLGAPLVVTAEQDGWAQVTLADGRSGWVREDLLSFGGKHHAGDSAGQVASNTPNHDRHPARPHHTVVAMVDDRLGRRKNRHTASVTASLSRKHHETQHPPHIAHASHHPSQVAHTHKRHQHSEVQMASNQHHHHVGQIARANHSRHLEVRLTQSSHHRHHGHGTRYIAEAAAPEATTDVVRTAYAYRGTPYVYGGAARGGFDCSGFTSYVYARKGVALPHSARGQFARGQHVSRESMKPGDLVFFHTVTPGISHVGIYVGNGRFVHASSRRSGGVRVDRLDSGYYSGAFRGARRMAR